jgi:hypothetical protein
MPFAIAIAWLGDTVRAVRVVANVDRSGAWTESGTIDLTAWASVAGRLESQLPRCERRVAAPGNVLSGARTTPPHPDQAHGHDTDMVFVPQE